MTFADAGDNFELYFGGTDVDLLWSDGALNIRNKEDIDAIVNFQGKDGGEKAIVRVMSDGDDNYIELHHDDTDGHIITDTGDIHIEPAGGDVSLAASNLNTTGLILADGNLTVGNTDTSAGVLTLLEDDDAGANFASFQVPALAGNTVYTLPADDGDNLEILQTNGAGVLDGVVSGARNMNTAV